MAKASMKRCCLNFSCSIENVRLKVKIPHFKIKNYFAISKALLNKTYLHCPVSTFSKVFFVHIDFNNYYILIYHLFRNFKADLIYCSFGGETSLIQYKMSSQCDPRDSVQHMFVF